jgi:hypothetical protein
VLRKTCYVSPDAISRRGASAAGALPRIRVAQIVADHLGYGWSAAEIVRQYPHLKPAEVHAALAYYFDHEPEIARELADELKNARRGQQWSGLAAPALGGAP